jgi:dTDP-4-amino-4,6-dideoxygalactose transaminase
MNNSKIWLSSPHMGGTEQKYVQEAFDTNWVAPLGPNVNGLEQDLESYLGEQAYVGALSSGTAAIHLGLILLGVKAGDEVICQSMTFSASANPILYQGAIPVFIDSELETWNMCPVALEEAIVDRIAKGKKPKAIIAVHLYGVPYQVDEISAVAAKYEIPVLEDSAEALGSSYKGQKCGTFGDIGVLSFNGNKIITTSGGGAIVTKTQERKDKAVFYATQSRDNAPHYQHSEIGYNYRMSNICAGIGRGQMEVLDEHVALRRKMNAFYVDLFKEIKGIEVFTVPNEDYFSNYWLSAILIDPEMTGEVSSESIRLALETENIECRPLWKPMHLQPVFENYPYYGNKIAESLFENGLCLPSGSNLTDGERERIKMVFCKLLGNESKSSLQMMS